MAAMCCTRARARVRACMRAQRAGRRTAREPARGSFCRGGRGREREGRGPIGPGPHGVVATGKRSRGPRAFGVGFARASGRGRRTSERAVRGVPALVGEVAGLGARRCVVWCDAVCGTVWVWPPVRVRWPRGFIR
ncbi:P0434C04.29 [Oryza sativa (japonica cultivar-group)]|uniref:Uncharacterized protein n=1 Tax=Oryza sativa subsp. japonica TaxID=39947 RepID=Q8L595_ORYSJ|nr:hypothetical protein [Oryza sativa Japonica Group]BAD82142.1 hypothetical protein [Oryza sativa Japonica Group]